MSQDTLSLTSKAYEPSRWWRKYRIVTDRYKGYESQVKYIWWPFWIQPTITTHRTVEEAEQYIIDKAKKWDKPRTEVIKYV